MPVLGKVGLVNKGEYSSSASYTALDFVQYDGSTYVAKRSVSGVTPSNDGTNWQYMARGASLALENDLLATVPGVKALDANQGRVLKGLIDNVSDIFASDTSNDITNLDNVASAVGTARVARVAYAASVSPTGERAILNTICLGTGAYRTIYAVQSSATLVNNRVFINNRQGDSTGWVGWITLTAGSPESPFFFDSAATASGSKTFTITNNTRALMFAQSASTADTGLWGIGVTSAGVVAVTAMHASSTLTITTGTRSITVANNSTRVPLLYFIVFTGSVS